MADLSVNVIKTINAPLERVFEAWLNAETLSKFILPAPGMPEPTVETDGCEGGSFTILMQVGNDKIPHTGKYLEVSRHSRIVFTWESPFSAEGSTVTLGFKALNEDSTEIDLTQVKFIDEQARDNHQNGWGNILGKLDEALLLVDA